MEAALTNLNVLDVFEFLTMPTISKEDYLKTIYLLNTENEEYISTSHVAEQLQVSSAATTDMVKKLARQGLVQYKKYQGMKLTPYGKAIALSIIRRHRLWETFLIKVLGLQWSEVHDEAERLEHNTSEFLLAKIDAYLGHPKFDPHGSPIPGQDGSVPEIPDVMPLQKAPVNKPYRVVRVSDYNGDIVRYFTRIGIDLYDEIFLEERLSFDKSVVIRFKRKKETLSETAAAALSVVPSETVCEQQ